MSEAVSRQIDVSILIVSWNTRSELADCLKSVRHETRATNYEVIVIDNGSSDGTPEMLQNDFPWVRTILNGGNRGFAAANNQGMREATGRYVLLLNSDTVILDGAIDKTFRFAERNPRAAVIACRARDYEGLHLNVHKDPSLLNIMLMVSGLAGAVPRNRFFGRGSMGWWDHSGVREVDWTAGCFMLVRRVAIDEAGMMDERYFMYCEDADWCRRFRSFGWEVLYFPGAEFLHLTGASSREASQRLACERRRSMFLYFREHRGAFAVAAADSIFAVGDLAATVRRWFMRSPDIADDPWSVRRRGREAARPELLRHYVRRLLRGDAFGGWLHFGKRLIKLVVSGLFYVGWIAPGEIMGRFSSRRRSRLITLYYHGVPAGRRRAFAAQMDAVLRAGVPVYPDELPEGDSVRPFVAVTFDDAYEEVLDNAIPEMEKRGIPATVFVPTANLGSPPMWHRDNGSARRSERVITAGRIRQSAKGPVRFGSHTASHRALDRISDGEAREELSASKRRLEEITGKPVESIAFPYGAYTERTVQLAQEAGYRRAFTIHPSTYRPRSGRFLVGRYKASCEDWPLEFWLKVRGAYAWPAGIARIERVLPRRPARAATRSMESAP